MNDITQRLRQYCTDWNGEPLSDETTPMDGLHCITLREAADEIGRLHTGIKRLSDEEELCAETTGDDPFSMVYLASRIKDRESEIDELSTLYSNAIARAEKAEEALRLIVDWADLVLSNREEFESHHSADMLTGPAFDAARELLNAEREVAQ